MPSAEVMRGGAPLLIQEGWRAERRGGYPLKPELQVAISTTLAPGATPPQLRMGATLEVICHQP
jgi:hypothetical protein